MAKKYLDNDGLLYFWQKIKTYFTGTVTPNMDGTGATGSSVKFAREDHVHPTDTSRAPVSHASSATTYGKGTSSNYGHVKLSDATNGTSAAASGGTAATPKAVADALTAAKAYADGLDTGVSDVTVDGTSVVTNGVAAVDLSGKVDKVTGKGLSTNDYTTAEKNKLAGIATGAEVNVQSDWNQTDNTADDYIKNKPTIPAGVTVDSALSSTSENPVQNKVIDSAIKKTIEFSSESTPILSVKQYGRDTVYSLLRAESKGIANGVCPLNASGQIDSTYLPSYVDDVIEAYARSGQTALSSTWLATGSASGTVITPETGKIYVLMADSGTGADAYSANTQFRWGGTAYVKLADGGVSEITNSEIDTIMAS